MFEKRRDLGLLSIPANCSVYFLDAPVQARRIRLQHKKPRRKEVDRRGYFQNYILNKNFELKFDVKLLL
jgi:hypothetical protein